MRGSELIVKHVDENLTIVTNHGVTAKIVQGNIKCKNGYIHMIDTVLTKVMEVFSWKTTFHKGSSRMWFSMKIPLT